jgi:hypothetical protein
MNPFDRELLDAYLRGSGRRLECDFIEGIRAIRLELMLLREQDRVRELEQGEWAHLEEVR